jgi:thiamine biosynthesis lipoprotein
MRPAFIITFLLLAIAALLATERTRPESIPWRTAHYENVLGTSMEIKLIAESEEDADRAGSAAMAEIKRLNSILSGYDPASEFSLWAGTLNEAVRVSPDLLEVLALWDAWRDRSGGALNPAAEAISRVWKQAQESGRMPLELDLETAAKAARLPQWQLVQKSGLATHLTTTPLILNSFTKSFIIERAASIALRAPGVTGVVLNIGGDLVVRGTASDTVNVVDPRSDAENSDPTAVLNVHDRAISTSGNYRRGFNINGRHYSHIVDPRTGQSAEQVIGVTVVARKAVDAGALATALSVLSPEEGGKLANSVSGTEYMLVRKDGTQIVSSGWNALQAAPLTMLAQSAPQRKVVPPASDTGAWNFGYELAVNVEIPQTQGFGARRPYVAVWIEDKDRFPVRTLAVLFDKTRWLNELRAWYRDDRLRAMSEGTEVLPSVTSATRSAGKYTFKWDGKDNAGRPVKAGPYTVLIEAAREHGGYSLDRKEMNFNGEPSEAQLPPDKELGTVALAYRKVAR